MSQDKTRIPDWASDHFTFFLEHQENVSRVLMMSKRGISMLRARHKAIDVLGKASSKDPDNDFERRLNEAKSEKEFAQIEVDNDFPLLHEQATVALWASLEALVRSFVAAWIDNNHEAMAAHEIQSIKVKIGEYESLTKDEKSLWIVDQLDRSVSGALKLGINRFESLFKPFGLDGDFDSDHKKNLFELSQIRNLIVHRSGICDSKVLTACPWIDEKIGERVKIPYSRWDNYNDSVAAYVLEIVQRLRVYYGLGRYEESEE